MEKEPYLASLLAEIETADITLEVWEPENFGWLKLVFPDSEIKAAKICLQICRKRDAGNYAHNITIESSNNAVRVRVVETFVDPLVHYVEDRIEEGSSVLGVLERYKRRSEWFQCRHLFDLYHVDTAHGEEKLDAHLGEYLVDQGIAYPFSQPASPSGYPDVVAGLDTCEPLGADNQGFWRTQ